MAAVWSVSPLPAHLAPGQKFRCDGTTLKKSAGSGAGNIQLRDWCHEFTKTVHKPAYSDFEILCTPGNTNAWSKVVGLLLEADDYVLCENFTYPSAQALWVPLGNHAAPIPLDDQGMRSDLLEATLANWESTHPGKRRPHVMYVVPIGSNPTGITYSPVRKQEIYDICVKYGERLETEPGHIKIACTLIPAPDIIIVEDDPYFFIQFPPPSSTGESSQEIVPNEVFLDSLSPSFLRYDYQGRVIRLESFAKTLAPGLRLGYFIANPVFTERLLRATEVDTQDPSGLSQSFVLSLLQSWGHEGFVRWLQSIRGEYQARRDWMVAAFAHEFEIVPAAKAGAGLLPPGEQGVVAMLKGLDGTSVPVPVFSFVPPTAGMFVWAKFYLAGNPKFKDMRRRGNSLDPEQTFATQLWREFSDELVSGNIRPTSGRGLVMRSVIWLTSLVPGALDSGLVLSSLGGKNQDNHEGEGC